MKKQVKQILVILGIYTIWWLAVIICVVSLQGFNAIVKQYGSVNQAYGNIIHTIIKGTITYYILIFSLAIPLIRTKKRMKVLFQYFLFLLFATIYEYIWNFKIGTPTPSLKHFSLGFFFASDLLLNILMAVIAIFIATWIESNDALKREGELEKQKLNAELSAIKYQINPHFLFNSLSFIYTKTVRQNPEAAHAVHLLSEIMSYALDEWEDLGRVPLALEISHMKKVIEMNQIRFNNKLNIEYDEDIEQNDDLALNNAYVPTLVFITLVENAFKHGDLNDEKNRVTITLKVGRSNIFFAVSNKKKKSPKEPSKGIGLSNVQQRLQLMYGDEQSFIIKENETHYLTEINIKLINHA
jgi:two-component system LytT family sensor kinase